ncbi:MAG: hypothetical protein PHF35_03265 [Candidatus Moranbacteria bacterium]|nr:hypothetical protein [Candidatus Moranbacteria bacterium]
MAKTREDYPEELEKQYKRMERLHDEIVNYFDSKNRSKSMEEMLDPVYDFFLICYHLREWIKKDIKVSQEIKNKIPSFEKNESPVQFLMCRDLCNKSKHVTLEETKNHKPNDANTKIVPYGGSLFIAKGEELKKAQEKKETLHLTSKDEIFMGNFIVLFRENQYDLKGVVQGCMHVWKNFFEENDLLLPRSTPYCPVNKSKV